MTVYKFEKTNLFTGDKEVKYFKNLTSAYAHYWIDRLPRLRQGYAGCTAKYEYIAIKTILPENAELLPDEPDKIWIVRGENDVY